MMPFSSKSLLCGHCWRRCRPATRQRLKLSRPSRTTGAKSTRNACRCTASLSPSSSRKPRKRRVWTSRRRNSPPPPAASRFSDREAFLAALLDDETAQRLTQLKQTLEQQLQQAAALCEQATRQHEAHWRCVRKGWTLTSPPCKPSCTPWPSGCGITLPARVRSASSSGRTQRAVNSSRRWGSRLQRRRSWRTTGAISIR